MISLAEGNRQALKEIYEASKSSVYGYALSILKDRTAAEDVMQDTYLKLYQNAGQYKPEGKPLAYLLTIARNLAYNRMRSMHGETYGEDYEHPVEEAGLDRAENRMLIDIALKALDDTDCQIVVLHAVSGLKHREIAECLGLKLSTVLSRYNRALGKMRQELERKGIML